MKTLIDFDECLRDTPKFRSCIETVEGNIDQLEQKLDKVLKYCNLMIDAGKTFVGQQNQFTSSLWELSQYFTDDEKVMSFLNKLIQALQEMNKFHTILLDQASRTVVRDLSAFIKSDVKKAKESRHYFEKISNDLDIALNRNSQVPKTRPAEYEEVSNILSATRSCFRHTALDYVHALTMLQSRRRHEILGSLLSYMHACFTYYHQGSDLAQDLDSFLKDLSEDLVTMRQDSSKLEKEMENRHVFVTSRDLVPSTTEGPNKKRMEGYLFKRTSNAFKTWNRRWFCLKDHQLVYKKRTGDDEYTVMEEDLRLCTVKSIVDCERRNCFEVLSPTKSHILQADSEEMYLAWVTAMQQAIGAAIQRGTSSYTLSPVKALDFQRNNSRGPVRSGLKLKTRVWEQLLKIPGNDTCCDCGSPNPKWASINLGITLCIECSGIHRSLGVHYSKVRSLTLDDWEPEILKVMAELGNNVVNNVYEAVKISNDVTKATPKCINGIREAWIKAKYVDRKFVRSFDNSLVPAEGQRDIMRFRKWSVRKLRRRPRSQRKIENKIKEGFCEADEVVAEVSESEASSVGSDDKELKNSLIETKQVVLEGEKEEFDVLMFGCDLPKPFIESSLELSSDQDSTAGEEEEFAEEEDIENLHADMLLYKAAAAHNLPVMCTALAAGADKMWCNVNDRGRTALHQAIISGSVMSYESGVKPLSIAVKEANADIVTLLRLGLLNEEMKDSEIGITGDETFNDVVRDFSQLACSHPERLHRRNEGSNVQTTPE
ncbi:hypothetical protein G9C98_001628 [Cotesia typhae]|uniref:Arf-GAP with coiled-coil, ANK repeat and PH domain-containing protein 2 n=1 Tax=Cotesia typhae TaxID=2053667 RepID=A0A8J5R0K5_9HYME|nr:hypothetical protein G9C98_001628 [Cotesia typhae]